MIGRVFSYSMIRTIFRVDGSTSTAYRLKLDGSAPTAIVSNVDAIAIAP